MTNPPKNSGAVTSSDLTFITNEPGHALSDRFGVLLGDDTRLFDCLVGYFFISGFHRLHPALAKTEKIRILVGIKTDGATYELIQTAKTQQEFVLESHAQVRERVPGEILAEFQKSGDSSDIEDGVRKFVEWIKSGKLEVRAYPSERVHAKLYIMTFHEGDRDKIVIPDVGAAEQKPVERLVDRILAAKQRDAGADTSALEREIDELVYALYGLTPEEIKIVEEAGK